MSNDDLIAARKNKQDEFYTQLTDIEKELKYYKGYFHDQTVLCNCDDPYESNFFKYFALNFKALKIRRLIATSYSGSPILGTQLPLFDNWKGNVDGKTAYKVEISDIPDLNEDGAVDLSDVELLIQRKGNVLTKLLGDGDFRSSEVMELLDSADIVATNPPFSLFREFITSLVSKSKKFAIIGNVSALTTNQVFPMFFKGKVWLGPSISSGDRVFQVPSHYPLKASGCWEDETGKRFIKVKGVRWFTNFDHPKRHEDVPLFKKYSPEAYPEFNNYNAINVNHVADIPFDFEGPMGVPITFLDKHNPDQFELLDANEFRKPHQSVKTSLLIKDASGSVQGVNKFARVVIRRR
jgi:hypothetical protein